MKENKVSRREFSKHLLGTALSISFLETLFTGCSNEKHLKIATNNRIIAPKASEVLNHWSIQLNELCQDLKTAKIPQQMWQEQLERLYGRIDLEELLGFIDFEKLTEKFEFPDLGVNTKPVKFPKLDRLPEKTVFFKKVFGMKKGRAIVPHGHSNMASAHLILKGELSLRQYEKVSEEKSHLVIKPTIDKSIKKGEFSSISDQLNNVHWFIANSENAYTFDVIMLDLNDKKYDIHNLDIDESEKLESDLLRVKKIDVNTALKKYGKDHHKDLVKTL